MNIINYRRDIDALRGIAVLLVVVYHAFPNILPGGFIGVDVFFVISGYLITTIIHRQIIDNDFSFFTFYGKRIKRLFPALITVLLTSLVVGWLVLFPDEYRKLGSHALSTVTFVQNFALINEIGYFDVSNYYKPLLHFWTLSIEEQYYLFWPVFILLIHKTKINALSFCAALVFLSFCTNLILVSEHKDIVYFHSLTRFWEIGVGSLLSIYSSHNKNKSAIENSLSSNFVYAIGILMILSAAFLINSENPYPSWYAILPTIGASLIIITNIKVKHYFGLVSIGLISYPLYLWHWVIISYLYIYLGKTPSEALLFAAIIISILLAFLTYRYVERMRYSNSPKTTFSLVLIAVSIGVTGYVITTYDGFPKRQHLYPSEKFGIEFQRSPAKDKTCESLVSDTLSTELIFDYCRAKFNNDNEITLAIIGDSHAHAIFPGVASVAADNGYNSILLANSSCPTLKGFMWGRSPKEIKLCQRKIDQILLFLELNINIEKVVILTRGPVYIHGEVGEEFTKESIELNLKKTINPDRQSYETYFSGFRNTLNELQSINHIQAIYYYLENPELDFLPKEVIPRPFDYFGVSTQESTVSRDLYQLRMNRYKESTLRESSEFMNVTVIDVEPYFCFDSACIAYKNGNFLYADDDHFSVFGSFYIARKSEHILFED